MAILMYWPAGVNTRAGRQMAANLAGTGIAAVAQSRPGDQYGVSTRKSSQFRIEKWGIDMSDAPHQHLLEALLDSWGRTQHHPDQPAPRSPEGGLAARAMESSTAIAEMIWPAPDGPRILTCFQSLVRLGARTSTACLL